MKTTASCFIIYFLHNICHIYFYHTQTSFFFILCFAFIVFNEILSVNLPLKINKRTKAIELQKGLDFYPNQQEINLVMEHCFILDYVSYRRIHLNNLNTVLLQIQEKKKSLRTVACTSLLFSHMRYCKSKVPSPRKNTQSYNPWNIHFIIWGFVPEWEKNCSKNK